MQCRSCFATTGEFLKMERHFQFFLPAVILILRSNLTFESRGLQLTRAPSYTSPNSGVWGGEVQGSQPISTTMHIAHHVTCTAKTKYRNFESNIPRKGISGSQSQFPHSCVWELFIYSTIGLPILLEEICRPILGLYKSLTDTWMLTLGLRPRYSQKRNTWGFSLQCGAQINFGDLPIFEGEERVTRSEWCA